MAAMDTSGFGLNLGFNAKQRGTLRDYVSGGGDFSNMETLNPHLFQRLQRMNEVNKGKLAGALGIQGSALPRTEGGGNFGIGGFGLDANQRGLLREAAAQGPDALNALFQNRTGLRGRYEAWTPEQKAQLSFILGQNITGRPASPAPGTPDNPVVDPRASQPPATPLPHTTTLNDYLQQYAANPLSSTNALNNLYTQGASRLTAAPQQPSYEDQFSRWLQTAQRGADQQAANITEAFGSRGNRYSSDLLNAQGALRQQMAQNIGTQADAINQGLNQQRSQELSALSNAQAQTAQAEQQRLNNAQQLFIMDYLRQSGAPQLLGAASQYAQGFGNPGTVVY